MPLCPEQQEILSQIEELSREKATILKDELAAVLAGESTEEIGLRLENALTMRKLLLERLKQHIVEHKCPLS